MGPRSAALEREVERLRTALNETVDKFEAGMTAAQRKRSELEKEIRKGEAHARHMARLLGKENQQREQAQKRAQALEELLRRAKIALERRLTQQVASGQTPIGLPQSPPALNPASAPTQEQGHDGIVNAARHEAIEQRSARQRESYLAELSDARHEVRDALERLQINNSLLSEAQQRQIDHAALEEERQRALQRTFKRERSAHHHTALLWTMRCVFRSHERRLLLLAWVSLREHARDQRHAIAERKLRRRERVAALAYQCKQSELSLARKARALRLWAKAVQMHQDAISRAVVKLARAIRIAYLRLAWRKFRVADLSARWASRLRDSVHLTWRASLRTQPKLKICADAWDLWLRFLRRRQSARKRIAKCEYVLLRKRVRFSLSRWRAFAQLKARQERKSKSLVSIAAHRNKRLLGLGFSTWMRRSYRASRDAISQSSCQLQGEIIATSKQERKRDAHRAASRLISMLLMRRVQSLWQSGFSAFAANARRLDQRHMTFLRSQLSRAHTKKLLQDLFQAWKDRTHLTRASQRAMLRRYFRRIRSVVQCHGKLRRAAHAVSRWFQRDAFASWRFHVYRKVKLASLLHHRRRRAMRTSLSRWVRVSILQGRNDTMDRVADGVASLAKASSARSIVTLLRMRNQERKRAALARLREVAVLTSLQDTSKAIFALANINLRGRANLWDIGRAFSYWKRVATLPLEAARKIFRTFAASRRRRAFATWRTRASASSSAMRRQQLQTGISYVLAKRCIRERVRKAFAALELHARKQMALRRAFRLQFRSLCRFAFATWARASTRTLQTQYAQSILQKASQRQSLLRIMFAIWRDNSFSSKRTRATAGILQSSFARAFKRARLRSAFDKLLLTARAKSKLSTYKRKLTKLDSSTGKLIRSYKVMDKDRRHLGTLLIAAYIAKHYQMLQLRGFSAFRSLGNTSGPASPWRQTHTEYHNQEALSELATCTGSDWASPEPFGEDYSSLPSRQTHVPEDVGSGTDQSMVTQKLPPSHCRQQSVALSPICGSSDSELSAACTRSSAPRLPRRVVARETSSHRCRLQSDHAARGHALSPSPLSSSPSSFAFDPKDPSKAMATSTSRHLSSQGSQGLGSQSYTVQHRGGTRSSIAPEYADAEKVADAVEAETHHLLHQRSRRQSYAPASPRHAQSAPRDARSWSGDWRDDSLCASNFSSSRRRGNRAHPQDANAREHGERTTRQDRVVVLDDGDNDDPYLRESDAEDSKTSSARHRHVAGSPRGDQRQGSRLRSGASSRERFNSVDNAWSQDPKRPFVTIDDSRMRQRSDELYPTKASRPAKNDKEADGDLSERGRSVANWVSTRPEKNKGRLEEEDWTEEEEEEEDVGKEGKAISPPSPVHGTMQSSTHIIAARSEPVLPRGRSPLGSSRKSLSSIEQEIESVDAEISHKGSRSSQTWPRSAQLDMRHAERPSYISARVLGESHDVWKPYRKSRVDDNVGGHLESESVNKSLRLTEREDIASMPYHHEWPVEHSPVTKVTKELISQTHRASPAPSEGLENFQGSQIGALRCASAKPFDDNFFDGAAGIAEDTDVYHSKLLSTATEGNMFPREVSPHSAPSGRGSKSLQEEDSSGAARNLQHSEARGDRLVNPRSADSEPAEHLADLLHSTREQLARVKHDQVRMLALQFSEEKSKNDSLASALNRFDNARSHAQKSPDNN